MKDEADVIGRVFVGDLKGRISTDVLETSRMSIQNGRLLISASLLHVLTAEHKHRGHRQFWFDTV